MKGKFIVFEGIDGCGKGTQAILLKNFLEKKGYKVKLTGEPSFSITGHILRIALKSDEKISPETDALLFAADRAQHTEEIIEPALDNGSIVLCERYILSSLAYQGCSVDENWIKEINSFALKPDLTIILDVPENIGLERRLNEVYHESRAIEKFEKLEFLKKVRERYLEFAKKENVIVIDATRSPEEIHDEIKNHVLRLLK